MHLTLPQRYPQSRIQYRHPVIPLVRFSDADWAENLDTWRSTTGYIIMLNNGVVVWRSQHQPMVALSTMEAKYMALTEATKELVWMRAFLKELGYGSNNSTNLFTNNQSALALFKNPVSYTRAKHIDICYYFIRDAIQDNVI